MRSAGVALMACLGLACGRAHDGTEVVAELGDVRLDRAELDASIAATLRNVSNLEGADRDRVCSRLLDTILEEKLLAEEARRRGVAVSQEEVVAYLTDVPPGQVVPDPEGARRHVASRKLQEALLRAVGPPSSSEVDLLSARLRAEAEAAGASVVLRSLRVASEGEAQEVARRVRAGETTFEREAASRDPETSAPLQVSLARLPSEVGTAVTGLKPGEISAAVRLHAGIYLFELVSRDEQGVPLGDLEEQARQELIRRRGEMAVRALLVQLRKERPLRLHRDRLGFRYVEDVE